MHLEVHNIAPVCNPWIEQNARSSVSIADSSGADSRLPGSIGKHVVEDLSQGRVREAVSQLREQGRVHEIPDREQRLGAIARDYANGGERTLVVAPDNQTRQELNDRIRHELKEQGTVTGPDQQVKVLAPRQDMTGADRAWAARYHEGDVIRYTKGSAQLGIAPGEYATVRDVDARANTLRVELHKDKWETQVRPAAASRRRGLRAGGAVLRKGRPGPAHRARPRKRLGKPRAWQDRANRRFRKRQRQDGFGPNRDVFGRAQAPGSRIRRHEPFGARHDRRPRHRSRGEQPVVGAGQRTLRVRRRLARTRRPPGIHRRCPAAWVSVGPRLDKTIAVSDRTETQGLTANRVESDQQTNTARHSERASVQQEFGQAR